MLQLLEPIMRGLVVHMQTIVLTFVDLHWSLGICKGNDCYYRC